MILQAKKPILKAIEPFKELLAYETLWGERGVSFKYISEIFKKRPGVKPSDLVAEEKVKLINNEIIESIYKNGFKKNPKILINGTFNYPEKLRQATEPIELLYYTGNLELLYSKSVAVVGSRNPSTEGLQLAAEIVKRLVKDDITIVSGLAKGIDTIAHQTAISRQGRTIAVIGTPLNTYYPAENRSLQEFIAEHHLLISQVPFYRYSLQSPRGNRLFFPERNKTMSAITEATIIVEASDTSGTLIQAKAALEQGRKLFILESCFQNKNISWPEKFKNLGAERVKSYEEIRKHLGL